MEAFLLKTRLLTVRGILIVSHTRSGINTFRKTLIYYAAQHRNPAAIYHKNLRRHGGSALRAFIPVLSHSCISLYIPLIRELLVKIFSVAAKSIEANKLHTLLFVFKSNLIIAIKNEVCND
jgi:hypothetical protein